jgi:hypothetical protein
VLVAAVMRAFLAAWIERIGRLRAVDGRLDLRPVAEAGAEIAGTLLTMAIRALDYTPPIHLRFGDYLSALVTADAELRADDALRTQLLHWFGAYGIAPTSDRAGGLWNEPAEPLDHEGVRFGSLQTDPIEMFRLVWANRAKLQLDPNASTRVTSVRPCIRNSPDDGLPLRETVAEVIQSLRIPAGDLESYGLKIPAGMPPETSIALEGGSTLILDEYARLKYEIHNRLPGIEAGEDQERAQKRLEYLWQTGAFDDDPPAPGGQLAAMHRRRAGMPEPDRDEAW